MTAPDLQRECGQTRRNRSGSGGFLPVFLAGGPGSPRSGRHGRGLGRSPHDSEPPPQPRIDTLPATPQPRAKPGLRRCGADKEGRDVMAPDRPLGLTRQAKAMTPTPRLERPSGTDTYGSRPFLLRLVKNCRGARRTPIGEIDPSGSACRNCRDVDGGPPAGSGRPVRGRPSLGVWTGGSGGSTNPPAVVCPARFGVLAFGVAARSAFLCWSMLHIPIGQVEPFNFGPYFLVPFGLALGVILPEIGLVERRPGVLRLAPGLPRSCSCWRSSSTARSRSTSGSGPVHRSTGRDPAVPDPPRLGRSSVCGPARTISRPRYVASPRQATADGQERRLVRRTALGTLADDRDATVVGQQGDVVAP